MKARKVLLICFFHLCCLPHSMGQIVEKNANSLEAYYGMPDLWNSLFRNSLSSSVYSLNMRSQGPWGARFEHMVSTRIGLGIDVWYVRTSFTGIYFSSSSNSNVYFDGKLTRVNILPRMTIHLAKHEKLDPYVHFGIGYLYSQFYFRSSNQSVYNETNPLLPVTVRVGIGLKYYLSQDFGGFIDVGLGGPLISIGLFSRWREK